MSIDRIDNRRDDERKAEQKRDDLRRENQRRDAKTRQTSHSFQVQYNSAAQSKKKELDQKKDSDPSNRDKDGEKKNESLLFKIVQSVKSKEEKSGQQEKDLMKKEEDKKEEIKSEKKSEGSSSKNKSVAEDGHKRVGETDGNQKQDSGSGGGGNQGGGGGSSGGGGGGSMGNSKGDSGFGQSSGHGGGHESQQNLQRVHSIVSIDTEMNDSENNLADSSLDELVEAIFVGTNREGHDELVLHLNDPALSGIKLSIVKMPDGLQVKLKCESRQSRNKLVMERLKLYDRLKKKNLSVIRIDIE